MSEEADFQKGLLRLITHTWWNDMSPFKHVGLDVFQVQPRLGLSGYWKCVKQETLKGAQEALRDSGSPF